MRFERLTVPAFGPFTDFVLDLPASPSDLHLIFGPNEAGKSSLLRAIRDLLYGIHGQTPDSFLHEYKDLRIGGTISDSGGRRLSFQRRKGNRNTLLSESGDPLPEETLAGFLGVVDRAFFTTIFALGPEELRQGAEALLHGRGELGQALFSASLAGTPVHRILDALDQESRKLYSGRARTQVSIRPAIGDYEASLRQCKETTVRPEAWGDVLQASAHAEAERDRLDDALRAQRGRRDWLQRCLDALPTIGQLSEAESKRAKLPDIPDLGAEFIEASEQALAGRDQAQEELSGLGLRVDQLVMRVEENRPNGDVLSRLAEIRSAHQRFAVYQQWKNEQLGLETESTKVEYELRAGMKELGLDGEPGVVEALRVVAADELALREAARVRGEATDRLQENREETVATEGEINKIAAKLDALPTADVSALRAGLRSTETAGEAYKGLPEREVALETARRQLEAQSGLLRGAPEDDRAVFDLPVPAIATLRRFDKELSQIDQDRSRSEVDISALGEELTRLAGQLERLERRGALPSLEALHHAREYRDRGWERVLAAWQQGAEEGELDGRPLCEAYPLTVKQADEVADRLRDAADAVAQAEGLRLQMRETQRKKVESEVKLDAVKRARADWEVRWIATWSPCGVDVLRPAEMLGWRDQWMEFRTRYEAWKKAQTELARAQSDISKATRLLAPLLSACSDRSLSGLRDEAERRVREADQAQGARAELKQRETDRLADLAELSRVRPGLEEVAVAARGTWQGYCRAIGLPTAAGSEAGLTLLDRRKQLVHRFDEWSRIRKAIRNRGKDIARYEFGIHELADALGLPAAVVDVRESALWQALETARERRVRQEQARGDLEQELEKLPQARNNLADRDQRVADCISSSGSCDEGALKTLLSHLKARRAIDSEIEGLRQVLHVSARGESLDSFIERVRAEPADALAAERDGLERAIPGLEAQRDRAVEQLAKAKDEKAKLERSGAEASEHLQSAFNTAARIRHDASRCLRLQLAIHFLRNQIEQFRKQNQGPLLARAGEIFRAITEESFEGLGTTFEGDDTPMLVGVRGGEEIGIEGMSDGTRDQLYLALRLAAIERHLEHHETMPVILDDLLMTFDNQRAGAILPILHEFGSKTQVMLFTHHRHLVGLAGETLGESGLQVHELLSREADGAEGTA